MILNNVIPVTGVPFVNSTRGLITIQMKVRNKKELVIEIDTKTLDAPYCDTFTCKEVWILMSGKEDEPKSILIKKHGVMFVKSTIFKSKIMGRAMDGQIETGKVWLDYVTKNGLLKKKSQTKLVKSPASKSQKQIKKVMINENNESTTSIVRDEVFNLKPVEVPQEEARLAMVDNQYGSYFLVLIALVTVALGFLMQLFRLSSEISQNQLVIANQLQSITNQLH